MQETSARPTMHTQITQHLRRWGIRASRVLRGNKSVAAVAGTAAVVVVLATQHACQPSPRFKRPAPVYLDSVKAEPEVRVRVRKGAEQLHVTGPILIRVGPDLADDVRTRRLDLHTPITIGIHPDGFLIRSAESPTMTWDLPVLVLATLNGGPVEVRGAAYPGRLVLHRVSAADGQTERFDVVNRTALEDYLPGVVHREIYPDWHPTAFMVQAIAARTYAIEQIAQYPRRSFHLESTQVSQAYGGARATLRALDAVRLSRGVVLTYNSRLVPTYYSSCCGGIGQDAAVAFPYGLDVRPLKGTAHDYCRTASTNFSWGPITRDRASLTRRIAAWCSASKHPGASIRRIKRLRVTAHNAAGRPARFTVTDSRGRNFHFNPEEFRFACNYVGRDLPPLSKSTRLKSSFVRLHLQEDTVSFTGRGFGHGVGLCQWGAQMMAGRNYDVAAIFATYYPGATLRRAY